jgi:hypothetical protein
MASATLRRFLARINSHAVMPPSSAGMKRLKKSTMPEF